MSGYVLHYDVYIFVFFIVWLYYFKKCKGIKVLSAIIYIYIYIYIHTHTHTHTNEFSSASGAS